MSQKEKEEITKLSKAFFEGFKGEIDEIAGSEWLIADPLSGYLKAAGFEHELGQLPRKDNHPQIIIFTFKDGSRFIPAGSDLPHDDVYDWLWV